MNQIFGEFLPKVVSKIGKIKKVKALHLLNTPNKHTYLSIIMNVLQRFGSFLVRFEDTKIPI
jgi:hypothetical protein